MTEINIDDYFKECADSVTEEGLQKCLTSGPSICGDTQKQLKIHGVDVCVVSHRTQNDIMCYNPVVWTPAEYWISDVFEKDGVKFKVFLGDC